MGKYYNTLLALFERTTFVQCFLFWLALVVSFGILYYFISFFPEHALLDKNNVLSSGITGLATAEYFSFITALSVGYGDVTPVGISRFLSVVEAVTALLLVGIIVSKLVSVKQEQILEEVYDISFDEKVNRLRSGLYLFRADAHKVIEKVQSKQFTKREASDVWLTTLTLDTSLHDVYKIVMQKKKDERYIKTINPLNLELLLNSMELSLSKLDDMLNILTLHNHDWRSSMSLESINSIINTTELIFGYYKNKNLEEIKIIQKLDNIRAVTNSIRERITMANAHLAQQLNLRTFEQKV